jgi:hypothetical protein
MKLAIDVTANTGGWTVTYASPELAEGLSERTLGRCGTAANGFPLPPAAESAAWIGQPHAAFCEAKDVRPLEDAYQRVILGQADVALMKQFGSYLTAVLLGPHVARLRENTRGELIEVHLGVSPDAGTMLRLPWELMYGPGQPLVADDDHPIGLVRVVSRGAQPATNALELPLRVLFVIGQTLDDRVRPGAEYMTLLRRLATTKDSVNFISRLLLQATADEIEAKVDEFAPSVVHFICHGDFDEVKGQATLMLTKVEAGEKTNEMEPLTVADVLQRLRGKKGDAKLPSVVVLNACHTAAAEKGAERKNAYRSFAATLVANGIPVAVGMAGEVADGACRLFTTGFYEALLQGTPVAIASARGRRAALRKYKSYENTVEWARPVLFMARDVCELKPVAGAAAPRAIAAAKYLVKKTPGAAFCDRIDCFQEFEQLLERLESGAGEYVLGFAVNESVEKVGDHKPQFGKTRLLEEVAARLVLEGIAPMLVVANARLGARPKTPYEFAQRVGDIADATRERFGLKPRPCSAALELAMKYLDIAWDGQPGVSFNVARTKVQQHMPPEGIPIDEVVLRNTIAEDAAMLVADLEKFGIRYAALLVDDLHLFDGIATPLLQATGTDGLGQVGHPVPLIFTYLGKDLANGQDIATFMTDQEHPQVVLAKFDGVEGIMAHRQFLLTRVQQPLAFSSDRELQPKLSATYDFFKQVTSGVPSGWETADFANFIKMLLSLEVLVEANDEEIVKQYG